jgi:hypothetical protein
MNKNVIIGIVLVVALGITGFVVFKTMRSFVPSTTGSQQSASPTEVQEQQNTSVAVDVSQSQAKANTIILTVDSLTSSYTSLSYEITYESKGITKGVTSGNTPLDVSGKDTWSKEVYLGTCSKNDCKPDVGVTKVSVSLEFTDTSGTKTLFSKDFPL